MFSSGRQIFDKIVEYLTSCLVNSVTIYIVSLIITIFILLGFVNYCYYKSNIIEYNLVLDRNIFGRCFLICLTLFTLVGTFYQNHHTEQFYDNKIVKYNKKIKNIQIGRKIVNYDNNMLLYYTNNKKNIKKRNHYRLYSNSHKLISGDYSYKDPIKLLINKNHNKDYYYIPKTFFVNYNKYNKILIMKPNSTHMKKQWKHYKHSLDNIKLSYHKMIPLTKYFNALQGINHPVYKVTLSKRSRDIKHTGLFLHTYYVHKLPKSKVHAKYGLKINKIPRYIYFSKKTNIKNLKRIRKDHMRDKTHYFGKISKFNTKKHNYLVTGISKYVDACNFQIFIQFMIDLILFNFFFNISIGSYSLFELLSIKYIYYNDANKYAYRYIYGFYYDNLILIRSNRYNIFKNIIHVIIQLSKYNKSFYYINSILDRYVFKLMPLVIAVMSGMFAMHVKRTTSGLFAILIKFTIPILSSIQFFRLMYKIYKNTGNKD